MVNYNCDLCKFTSKNKYDHTRHISSKKHIKNYEHNVIDKTTVSKGLSADSTAFQNIPNDSKTFQNIPKTCDNVCVIIAEKSTLLNLI